MRVELWRGGRAGRFIWYRLLEERKKVLRQGVQRGLGKYGLADIMEIENKIANLCKK